MSFALDMEELCVLKSCGHNFEFIPFVFREYKGNMDYKLGLYPT